MSQNIISSLAKGISYEKYREEISSLLKEGKVTGNEQSEDLLKYSELNEARMNRLEKTIVVFPNVEEKLKKLTQSYTWLVIAEGWCGDAAQIVPIISKMANVTDKIDLKIVFRDENEPLMQDFLTNGARAIPVVIILDNNKNYIAHWGPRPTDAKQLILDYKKQNGVVDEPAKIALQKWYLNDKGKQIQEEIIALF